MSSPGRGNVLLIEDEPDLRGLLAEVLEREGYAVALAENGSAALALLRAAPAPDLIFVDLMMPVMNGLRFRAAQLEDPMLAEIPTIALTASRTTQEQLAGLRFTDILYKPFQLPVLFAALELFCAPTGLPRTRPLARS